MLPMQCDVSHPVSYEKRKCLNALEEHEVFFPLLEWAIPLDFGNLYCKILVYKVAVSIQQRAKMHESHIPCRMLPKC